MDHGVDSIRKARRFLNKPRSGTKRRSTTQAELELEERERKIEEREQTLRQQEELLRQQLDELKDEKDELEAQEEDRQAVQGGLGVPQAGGPAVEVAKPEQAAPAPFPAAPATGGTTPGTEATIAESPPEGRVTRAASPPTPQTEQIDLRHLADQFYDQLQQAANHSKKSVVREVALDMSRRLRQLAFGLALSGKRGARAA